MNYNGFYQIEWGMIFKDKFKISSDGINWNGKIIRLDEVKGISWSITKTTYNHIISNTNYTIIIRYLDGEFYIMPSKSKIFSEIIDNVWRAVGINLMIEMLLKVKNGDTLKIGTVEFNDLGIFLNSNKFFSFDRRFFTWDEGLQMYSENGSIIISSKHENYSSSVSYGSNNAPVFEMLIKSFFKNFNHSNPRLSSLLQ